jgi:hypothetical protein
MGKPNDFTGQKFGELDVLRLVTNEEKEEYGIKRRGTFWWCKCNHCGREKIIRSDGLRSGIQTCGCITGEKTSERSRIKYGEASFNGLYRSYKDKAIGRKLVFILSKEEFRKITQQNCYYCGIEPKQITKNKNNFGQYIYNGIDRIDSSKGYILENVVPCCGRCNEAKLALSQNNFFTMIDNIYNNLTEKGIKEWQITYIMTCLENGAVI